MFRPYRWGFEIHDTPWSESLSHHDIGPDVAIVRDDVDGGPPSFYFTSQHFNDLEAPADIRARGIKLATLFDGAMRMVNGLSHHPEHLGALIDFNRDRRLGHQDPTAAGQVFSPAITEAPFAGLTVAKAPRHRLEAALWLSRTDPVVFGMLQTLGVDGVTYRSLYALRDFLKTAGMDDDEIRAVTGASKTDLSTFTRTANSFSAVGTASRHGMMNHEPPSEPMPLLSAARLILPAAGALVDKRAVRASHVIAVIEV